MYLGIGLWYFTLFLQIVFITDQNLYTIMTAVVGNEFMPIFQVLK